MSYLDDIVAQAQQGRAFDNLAQAYGISPDQARQATEAMMPAFALGLQRTTQTPQNFAELLGAMSRNPYGEAFQNPSFGFGDVRGQGNDALAAMFGSPEVSRAVAAQAAATTGLSSALLKQMLPAIAAMVLGGLMKGGATGGGATGGGLGDLLGGMLGGGGQAPRPQQAGTGSGNPLEDLLGGMLGGGAPQNRGAGGSGNPLEDLLGGMLGGRQGGQAGGGLSLDDLLGGMLGGGAQQRPRPQAPDTSRREEPFPDEEPAPPPGRSGSGNPLEDLLGSILGGGGAPQPRSDAGGAPAPGQSRAQDPRMQPFQDIFDQFFNGGGRR